ncbi:MAG: PEP-CTERM sorting domain-containing protein [Pseudomonadota bacterium]
MKRYLLILGLLAFAAQPAWAIPDLRIYIPGAWEDTASGEIKKFPVSVQGYQWADIVAYDHVVKSKEKIHSVFSPFSHDGGGGAVPEPATLVLIGSGLLGMGWAGRRRYRK